MISNLINHWLQKRTKERGMWKQIQDVAYLLAWWWIKMNKIWDFDVRISKKSFTHLPNPLDLFRGCYNIAMERSTIFKNGKPSISMGHLYHGYVSHNQRVYIYIFIYTVWMKDIPSSRKSWLLLCVFVWSIFVSPHQNLPKIRGSL